MVEVKLGKVSDVVTGKGKLFTVQGKRIAVFNVDGKFYGINGTCTHVGGPLWDGVCDGNVVTCPWHGAQFDVTNGKVLRGPAKIDATAYKIVEKGGELFVVM